MLERFSVAKSIILDQVDKIKASNVLDKNILESSGLEEDINNFINGAFKIAIIGAWGTGKTTLINSLIGKDLIKPYSGYNNVLITRVKFSKEIKLKIIYSEGNNVEIIDKDEEDNPLNEDCLNRILECKTMVKDKNNEETIREIIIYYPIDMFKYNIELIDTQSFFSLREKYESMIKGIFQKVNAFIFVIAPNHIRSNYFVDFIKNHIINDINYNVGKDYKNLFFVINKIGVLETCEIEIVKGELKNVLEGMIRNPRIFTIHAYNAMKGKMYLSGDINLKDIQRDIRIKIEDPEDPEFTISGRQITEENATGIVTASKIRSLEKELENCFQNKNMHLITNIKNKIEDVIKQSIEKIKFEKNIILESYKIDIDKEKQLADLECELEYLQDSYVRKINFFINQSFRGGTSRNASVLTNIEYKIAMETDKKQKELYILSDKTWRNDRVGLNKYNAEEKLNNYMSRIVDQLSTYSKEKSKEIFIELKNQIDSLISELKIKLDKINEDIENIVLKNIDLTGTFNNEVLIKLKDNEEYEKESIITQYDLKRFFTGYKECITELNEDGFKHEMEKVIREFRTEINEEFIVLSTLLRDKCITIIANTIEQLKDQSTKVVESAIKINKDLIETKIKEIMENEKYKEILIKEKGMAIKENIELLNQFLKIIDEIL